MRVLPELVVDWIKNKCTQNICVSFIQMLQVNMQISWEIEVSKYSTRHLTNFNNFTNRARAIEGLCNHGLIWIIPDRGS